MNHEDDQTGVSLARPGPSGNPLADPRDICTPDTSDASRQESSVVYLAVVTVGGKIALDEFVTSPVSEALGWGEL
jgi:hypothetical protein